MEALWVLYEIATILVPVVVLWLALRQGKSKELREQQPRVWLLVLCALYVWAVFNITGAGTMHQMIQFGLDIRPDQINLILFSQEPHHRGLVLNMMMFVPLGVLLPVMWPQLNRLRDAALAGFAFSLLIEMSQLINHRVTDVDDLLMNTAGAVLGYGIFWLVMKLRKKPFENSGEGAWRMPALYIGVMFLGRFLMYNELWIAKLVYQF